MFACFCCNEDDDDDDRDDGDDDANVVCSRLGFQRVNPVLSLKQQQPSCGDEDGSGAACDKISFRSSCLSNRKLNWI